MSPSVPFGSLQREWTEIGSEVQASLDRVLQSGHFILGPEVAAFEAEFASYCGTAAAVGVASGTDALMIGLSAAGVGRGDEVITTTLTSGATVTAIARSGATPVLVDVDPETLNIDPDLVAAAITPRTRAILPVHLYGRPVELDSLRRLADDHSLTLVEDCAQSTRGEYHGRRIGSVGDVGCFSFYPTKNLGAYGDGGMIVSSDLALLQRARELRTYGWRERDLSRVLGYNSRLDELQAALLRAKLTHLDSWNDRRKAIAELYSAGLAGLPELSVPKPARGHAWHLYVVRVTDRDAFRDKLTSRGIGTGVHYPYPIHRQPAFKELASGRTFTNAESACEEIVSLPIFPQVTTDEVTYVVNAIRETLDER